MNSPRKYRGIRVGSEEWVVGSLLQVGSRCYIPDFTVPGCLKGSELVFLCGDCLIEVIPETVGQSTGLKDKKRTEEFPNGQEIYEGDIVKTKYETMPPISIMWRDGGFYYSPPKKDPKTDRLFCVCEFTTESDEIIGNIHQNPHLMEGE